MIFKDLGLISFQEAFEIQQRTVDQIVSNYQGETIYLLEHPPTFTIGRAGAAENQLVSQDFNGQEIHVIRINRGGDITFHGPGQLVGYPQLDLKKRDRDVHRYLRDLEEVLIRSVRQFGVKAQRRDGLTGIWADQGKLASIGIGIRRWITMHGFALNVATDLRYFRLINPCGLENCPVTSLEQILQESVSMDRVKSVVRHEIQSAFS